MPLTTEQLSALAAELVLPAYADLVHAADDAGLANLLNARTLAGRRWVRTDVLRAHLMSYGIWPRLRTVLYSPEASPALKGACHFVIDACDPTALLALDLDLPACQLLFGTFEAPEVSLLSADEKAAILALGDSTLSRAELLFGAGVTVTPDEIGSAR